MTPERYVEICLEILDIGFSVGAVRSAEDLRSWWRGQEENRRTIGLSEAQEAVIADACKRHLETLKPEKGR